MGRWSLLAAGLSAALHAGCAGPPASDDGRPVAKAAEAPAKEKDGSGSLRTDLRKKLRQRAAAARKEAKQAEPLGGPREESASGPAIRRPLDGSPSDDARRPTLPGDPGVPRKPLFPEKKGSLEDDTSSP